MSKRNEKIFVVLFFIWFISSMAIIIISDGSLFAFGQYLLTFGLFCFSAFKNKMELVWIILSCMSVVTTYSIFYQYFDINKFMIVNEISLKCSTTNIYIFIFIVALLFLLFYWNKFKIKFFKYIIFAIMIIFLILSLFYISACQYIDFNF